MKLPVSVIAEALAGQGNWSLEGEKPDALFAYPRQFAGSTPPEGHLVVLSSEELASASAGGRGLLAVCSAPCPEAAAADFPVLCPARPVPEETILRCLTDLFDRMDSWTESLAECSYDLSGVQRMLEISAAAMSGDLMLIDESYNAPAFTGSLGSALGMKAGGEPRPDDASIAGLADDPQITVVRTHRGVQLFEDDRGGVMLFRNMFRAGEDTYYNRLLFLNHTQRYSQTDFFMLEHLARRIEQITKNLSTFSVPESRYAALKQLILAAAGPGYLETGDVSAALSSIGWRSEDSYRFFIFRSLYSQRDAGITDYILRRLERLFPGSCGAVDGERILLVYNVARGGEALGELRPRLAEFLRENMYKVGISNEAYSFPLLRGAYLQAEAAMRLGSLRDPMFWYYLFEDYLADYLLRKASEDIPAQMLTLPAVETLRRHDAQTGSHLTQTLRTYTFENFNATHAAQKLYIHRTSFQDRLERIRSLTGLDPDDSQTRFLLQFSFRLLEKRADG